MSIFLLSILSLPLQSLASSISDFNPVSHWTCDEEGGVRYDSVTATGNDLTDNNTVGFATGLLGNACDFESSNSEYLSITDDTQVGLEPTSLSISLWVKIETDTYYCFLCKGYGLTHDFPYNSYFLGSDGNYHSFYSAIAANSTIYSTYGGSTLGTATWKHLVAVFDTSNSTITNYVNGIQSSTNSFTGPINYSTGLFVLGRFGAYDLFYDGLIDEITFSDSVWSSTDVTTLYNSGTPLPFSGGTSEPAATTTPTTTPTTSDNGDLVFMLSVIVFFLSTFWVGYIISMFRKTS